MAYNCGGLAEASRERDRGERRELRRVLEASRKSNRWIPKFERLKERIQKKGGTRK